MTWWLVSFGCGVAYWRQSWRVFALGLVVSLGWFLHLPGWSVRLSQRLETYRLACLLSAQHPLVGVGAGPVALPTLCRIAGMPLPGPHSDLLALALLHGWLACLLTIWIAAQLVFPPHSSPSRRAVQAGLLMLLLAAVGRSVTIHPGYVLMVLLCSVYLLKERA